MTLSEDDIYEHEIPEDPTLFPHMTKEQLVKRFQQLERHHLRIREEAAADLQFAESKNSPALQAEVKDLQAAVATLNSKLINLNSQFASQAFRKYKNG